MESDDDDMDMRLLERIGVPDKGAMREINLQPLHEKRLPHRRDGFALADGIGRDKCRVGRRSGN